MKRERLLELCLGQGQMKMQSESERVTKFSTEAEGRLKGTAEPKKREPVKIHVHARVRVNNENWALPQFSWQR